MDAEEESEGEDLASQRSHCGDRRAEQGSRVDRDFPERPFLTLGPRGAVDVLRPDPDPDQVPHHALQARHARDHLELPRRAHRTLALENTLESPMGQDLYLLRYAYREFPSLLDTREQRLGHASFAQRLRCV